MKLADLVIEMSGPFQCGPTTKLIAECDAIGIWFSEMGGGGFTALELHTAGDPEGSGQL
jgi:hypothetical protein